MPSQNKTTYLNLNQWAETDRPVRNDFNSDNALVDKVLGEHVANGDIHVTANEKEYLKDIISVKMYSGTGESQSTVTLTESVRVVIVFAQQKPLAEADTASGKTKCYAAVGHTALGSSAGLSISSTGLSFTVSQGEDDSGNYPCLNESGVQYKVIMLK